MPWPSKVYGVRGLTMGRGDYRRAEPLLRAALDVRRAALAPDHRYVGDTLGDLGECLVAQGRYSEAEPLLTEAYGMFAEGQGSGASRTNRVRELLIDLYEAWGRPDRAALYIAERVAPS